MTPSQFYAEFLNKAVDFDGAYGVQCVDGFRVWGQFNGVSIPPTPNNWADGYWYYRDQLFKDRFDFILESDRFSDGDWVIWARGSKSHPNSHIAMFYHGQEFGENQGGKNGAFNLKATDFSDALGALRWKGYEKMIIEKGFHEISWNGITVDILRATKSSGYDLHLISAGDAFAIKDVMQFDSDKLAIVGGVNANYFEMSSGMHLGVEGDGFVDGYFQAPKAAGILAYYITDKGIIGAHDQSDFWLSQDQIQVACAPYSVLIHGGEVSDLRSQSLGSKDLIANTQTVIMKIEEDWTLAIFSECTPIDCLNFAQEAGASELALMDSGGSTQMFESATTGKRRAVRYTGRKIPNVLVLAKKLEEKGESPGLSDADSQPEPEPNIPEEPTDPQTPEEPTKQPTGILGMTNAVYDFLKIIAQLVLPAVATLIVTLGEILEIPNAKTIAAVIIAVDTFLGSILQISTNEYKKNGGDLS